MAYVAKGGTLLVTGPVNRDEHWQPVDRLSPLGVKAEVVPLAVRGASLTLPDGKTLALGFPAGRAAVGYVDDALCGWEIG